MSSRNLNHREAGQWNRRERDREVEGGLRYTMLKVDGATGSGGDGTYATMRIGG
jgi:hypothetical protein